MTISATFFYHFPSFKVFWLIIIQSREKDKSKKLHNCLVELKEFDDEQRKMTIIYDIYSYLYLPNYLAAGNYKIKF